VALGFDISEDVMLKRIPAAIGAVLMALVANVQIGSAQAGPEQKRLDPFVGQWRMDVEVKASAAAPASKASGTDQCDWFANMHVVCTADAGVYRSMRVISYIAAMKQYAMYTVDSYGFATFAMGQLQGSTWTFTTDVAGVKYRTVMQPGRDSYTSRAEYAAADGNWVVMSETKATRMK
jgi:hypothetical protein